MTNLQPSDSLAHALRRIATDDKIVRNRVLNVLGCQVARIVAAEILLRRRRRQSGIDIDRHEAALIRDGVVVIANFLTAADFGDVLGECERGERDLLKASAGPDKFGITRQKMSVRRFPDRFPAAFKAILGNEQLIRLARAGEGWSRGDDFNNRETMLTYERLEQVIDPSTIDAAQDPELSPGDLHTDSFHYITKAFLTLDDVTMENCPYTYVLGSHRLTLARLAWDYKNSLRREQYESTEYFNRIDEDERRQRHLEPSPLLVPKNTLIVTNTFGFHRRGSMTKKGAVRRMLRLDFRSNPFCA
jgi:hypothetical protein